MGGFDARGDLLYAGGQYGNPPEGLSVWMGQTDWFVDLLNVAVPRGEVAIGLGRVVGLLTRRAAVFGALTMLPFHVDNREMAHGPIDSDFTYMLVFLSVAAFGAGRILGLEDYVEQ